MLAGTSISEISRDFNKIFCIDAAVLLWRMYISRTFSEVDNPSNPAAITGFSYLAAIAAATTVTKLDATSALDELDTSLNNCLIVIMVFPFMCDLVSRIVHQNDAGM